MTQVLLAEPDADFCAYLAEGLEEHGYACTTAGEADRALELACSGDFDMVIIDVRLPGGGMRVLQGLRRVDQRTPVLLITPASRVSDTVAGLDGPAEDFAARPFSIEELLARVDLRLRAARGHADRVLRLGPLTFDVGARTLTRDGQRIQLTEREANLAEVFLLAPGRVLSRAHLRRRAWGLEHDPGSNVVDVYVSYLRRKLGSGSISTIRGRGYRLEMPD